MSATDDMLQKLEKKISAQYTKAAKEADKKLKTKLKEYEKQLKANDKALKKGKITQEQYDSWKKSQAYQNKNMQNMAEVLAKDASNSNQIAASIINDTLPDVYALNANETIYMIEKNAQIKTSFSLYDHKTVETLISKNPGLYPQASIKIPKDQKWNKRKMNEAITQGILQGESIPKISGRVNKVYAMNNSASTRTARTMVTSAQSLGRIDSYKKAEEMGIPLTQVWVAALDGRTRHSHRLLDGQQRDVGDSFQSIYGYIRYPADPHADPRDIYNCRCTLIAQVKGFEYDIEETANRANKLQTETYEEWKYAKSKEPELEKLTNKMINTQYNLSKVDIKSYSGIWLDNVNTTNWTPQFQQKIDKKKDYYETQIAKFKAGGYNTHKIPEFEKYLKDLDELSVNGKKSYELSKELSDIKKEIKSLNKTASPFDESLYTEEAKRAARLFTSREKADLFHRAQLDEIWKTLEDDEKYAIWEYTRNSNPMNKSLSGYHDSWSRRDFIGWLDTDWGHEDRWRSIPSNFSKFGENGHVTYKKAITDLTKVIEKSELQEAAHFVRGSDINGLAGILADGFGENTFEDFIALLRAGDVDTLQELLEDQVFYNHAFTSTGIAKGTGFGGEVSYEIYAPAGTKCIYAEPQSYFGNTVGMTARLYKKGEYYSGVGHEAEVIFQRGTGFRITGIEEHYGNYTIKMEVVDQPDFFVYFDENTIDKGATRHLT